MTVEIQRKAHEVLTRAYTDLYELLTEMNPPATTPLPPNRDIPARVWSDESLAMFTTVKTAYDAVEKAQLQLSRLRTEQASERGEHANVLLAFLEYNPAITRDEIKDRLGWDDDTVDGAIRDIAALRSEPAAVL